MLFTYSVLKTSWGIAIDLDLDLLPGDAAGAEILPGIFLLVADAAFDRRLAPYLADGVRKAGDFIRSKQGAAPVCFRLNRILYAPTDFQPNGLTYAIRQAIYQSFGSEPPACSVRFDAASNTYLFE